MDNLLNLIEGFMEKFSHNNILKEVVLRMLNLNEKERKGPSKMY